MPADDELPDRVDGVLRVAYLIFNEGYAASAGERLVRGELCAEAIRLGRLLCRLMPDDAEVWGLLALMLLHDARRLARVSPDGTYVALDEQDRTRWDEGRIREGLRALERAVRLRRPGQYQLQAAITALHIEAADGDTPTGGRSQSSTARLRRSADRQLSSSIAPRPSGICRRPACRPCAACAAAGGPRARQLPAVARHPR